MSATRQMLKLFIDENWLCANLLGFFAQSSKKNKTMKCSSILMITSFLICLFSGCKEEELPYRPPDLSTPDVVVPVIVEADAGDDVLVELPGNQATLIGSANEWDPNINIKEYYWTKISGPNSFGIVNRFALETKLFDLEKGVYELELTVKATTGQSAKDTATVIVGALSSNPREFLSIEQTWGQHMEQSIYIHNIYAYIPRGSFFKVYLRKDINSDWQEVTQAHGSWPDVDPYFFALYNGDLWLAATGSMPDRSDIKILYD